MSSDDEKNTIEPLEPDQDMHLPYRESRFSKAQRTKQIIASQKTGRKGRKTISEKHKKVLVDKHALEIKEKELKLQEKAANALHVQQQMKVIEEHFLDRPVNPEDISRVRTDLYNIVISETERARLFLEGRHEWNSNQVRLYGMLLNKVIPDLSQKFTEVSIEHRSVNELSRDELEAIVVESVKEDLEETQ